MNKNINYHIADSILEAKAVGSIIEEVKKDLEAIPIKSIEELLDEQKEEDSQKNQENG
jgi:uncharacterized protein (DUF433 family)